MKKIYTAPNAEIGAQNLEGFAEKWDKKYGYISKSWPNNWEQLSTFWIYLDETRTLIHTTNPIESFNRRLRKVTKNRPTFPSEEALNKTLSGSLTPAAQADYQNSKLGCNICPALDFVRSENW